MANYAFHPSDGGCSIFIFMRLPRRWVNADVIRLRAIHVTSNHLKAEWLAFHESLKLETAHQTVLSYLYFEGARPFLEAPSRSRSWAYYTCQPLQRTSEYRDAIVDMVSRGLLWRIDEGKQLAIQEYISSPKAIGPIDIMPPIDTLQYSIKLARLFDEFWASSKSERPACVYSPHYLADKSVRVYSNVKENCLEFIQDSGMVNPTLEKQVWLPKPCGPWRDQWWRLYDFGFVLEIPAECFIVE